MNKAIGFSNTSPLIKQVSFPEGKIMLQLVDGRTITLPIHKFPEIEKLSAAQKREHKTLAGIGLMFDDCDSVFHISDFLGKTFSVDDSPLAKTKVKKYTSQKSTASQIGEPKVKYKKA